MAQSCPCADRSDSGWEADLNEKFVAEIDYAIKQAEATAKPDTDSLFQHVFKSETAILKEQQAILHEELKERKSWEEDGAFPL